MDYQMQNNKIDSRGLLPTSGNVKSWGPEIIKNCTVFQNHKMESGFDQGVEMKEPSHKYEGEMPADYLEILYRRHFQGALVRSGASVIMWMFALVAYLANIIKINHFSGIALSVLYLVLINPPTLLLLKRVKGRRSFRYASLAINFLEIPGYTAIIYSLGGVEATFLTPIYAALITYVGVMAPVRFAYLIAILCSVAFSFVVAGEYFGFLPPQRVVPSFDPTWLTKWCYLSVVIGLLFVVAYISSLTSSILNKNRKELLERNIDLLEKTDSLEKSEEKYRFVTENATDVIWTSDLMGNLTFVTPSHEDLSGYTIKESIGANIADFSTKKSADKMAAIILERFATDSERKNDRYPPISVEIEIKHKNGNILQCEVAAKFIRDDSSEPIGIIGITRDITQRKKLEAELQQAQKMKAIGTLAGGVAHDFNNLLMAISGYNSLIQLTTDTSHPNYKHLDSIMQCVESASGLTKQLLGFARGGKYEVKTTNLNILVKDQCEMFGRTRKDIYIHGKYADDLWTAEVDRGQIEQVLMNIYVNAWQAMPEGGELHIQTENVEIDNSHALPFEVQPGKYVKIFITDTGIGMDEETRKRIFDPFFTTKEMDRGTGMGLASAYGIIKNHGGVVTVYSEPGQGSTFNIYLPASEKKSIDAKIPSEELITGTGIVLLIDDEDRIRTVGEEMLKLLGYDVMTASSGQEAITIYQDNRDKINLVILDMIMPGISGSEVYDRLKAINPDVTVLLASGYSLDGKAKDILNKGCDGFIQKPFTMKQLSQKINEILNKTRNTIAGI